MSFWSHLGDVASSLVDSAGNAAGAAWNVAKVTHVPQAIGTGFSDTMGALNKAYSYTSHGAAEGLQAVGDVVTHGYVSSSDLKDMTKRNLTYGQALVGETGGALSGGLLTSPSTIKQQATTGQWYDNPAKVITGVADAAFSWYGSPDILALKGLGEARDATRILGAEDLTKVRTAQQTGDKSALNLKQSLQARTMNNFLQATDDKSPTQLMQMRAFRDTPGADSLASLLSGANGITDATERLATKQTIFRAALGSQTDIENLRNMSESSYFDLMNARQGLDGETTELHLAQLLGINKHGVNVSPEAMTQWQQDVAQKTAEFNARYKDALDQETKVVQSSRILDGHIPTYGVLDRARVGTVAGKQSLFQGGIFSTPVNVWHIGVNTLAGARPSGVVNLNDANDVIKNLTWQIQRVRGISPEQAQEWINKAVGASTDADRFTAVQSIEHQIFLHVGKQALGHDVDEGTLNNIIQDYRANHTLARNKFFGPPSQAFTGVQGDVNGEQRFLDSFQDESGEWHIRPVLDTQLANAYPIIDTDYVYNTLKRSQSTFRAYGGTLKDAGAGLANMGLTPWKMLKLVRLGYPVRNMGDNFIRMMTVAGAFPLLHEALGEVAPAFLHNRGLGMTAAQKALYDFRSDLLLERNEIDHDLAQAPLDRAAYEATGEDLYHGTREDFSTFSPAVRPSVNHPVLTRPDGKRNLYFTPSENVAQRFADVGNTGTPRVIKARVYGKTLDLTPPAGASESDAKWAAYVKSLPEDLVAGLRKEGRFDPTKRGWQMYFEHEKSAYLEQWAREHGYGKIKVGDSFESGSRSIIALPEHIAYGENTPIGLRDNGLAQRRAEIESSLANNPMPVAGKPLKRITPEFRDHLGRGMLTHAGVDIPDAAGTTENELDNFKAILDPRSSWENTLGTHATKVRSRMAQAYDYERIQGSDSARYGAAWEHAVNHQLKQSPLVQQILTSGPDKAKTWLRNTPEGRQLVHRMFPIYKGDLDDMIGRASDVLDGTLGGSPRLRDLMQERNLKFQDLKDEFGSNELKYPTINAASIDATLHQGPGASIWNKTLEGWFRVMSDLPERNLARHPMTVLFYRQHTKDLIDKALADTDSLSMEDVNDIRTKAMGLARRDMKRTLYDVTSTPNLGAGVFRYLFPFYSAFHDVMTKYGRILLDNPEFAARFQNVWDAPNRAGMVVDQNGKPVGPGHGISSNQYIVMPSLPGHPGGATQWRIGKGSLNLVLQGDPFYLPGFGPLATYPANVIALNHPQLGKTFTTLGILPYGAGINATDQVNPLPQWAQSLAQSGALQGAAKHLPVVGTDLSAAVNTLITAVPGLKDSKAFDNTFAELAAVKSIDYNLAVDNARRTGAPAPKRLSPDEFFKQVGHETSVWLATKALAQGVMPTSQTPLNKYQYYFDQAHNYEDPKWQAAHPNVFTRANPVTGQTVHYTPEQAFYIDYPNYFEAMISLSKSNVGGVKPTVQGFQESQKWKKEIAQFPQYGSLFVGPGDDGSFSPDAYAAQFNTPVGGGSSLMQRQAKDPKTAVDDIEVQKGWVRYMRVMNVLDATLHKAGYQSFGDVGAEGLKAAKQAYTQYLANDDPQWWAAFNTHDDTKFANFLNAAQVAVKSPNAKGRGDLQGLSSYLQARQAFQGILAQRKAGGGSDNIDNSDNADLKKAFDAFGQYLKQRYVTFGDVYDRYLGQTQSGLERDNLRVVLK